MSTQYSVDVRETRHPVVDNRTVEILFTEQTGRASRNSNVERVTRELARELRDKLNLFLGED